MTGSNSAYDAMFERYGIVRVDDIEQMMAVTRLLSGERDMAGLNALILATGGGYGALFADACHARGIGVPDLSPDMAARPERDYSGVWNVGQSGRLARCLCA